MKEKNEHNDRNYLRYLEECKKGPSGIAGFEDLNSEQYPRSYEHFYRHKGESWNKEFAKKWYIYND